MNIPGSGMQSISTGPGTERLIRAGLFMLFTDIFAILFLLDGFGGYARKNAADFASMLGVDASAVAPDSAWTATRAQSEADSIRAGETADAVQNRLGPPTISKGNDFYYLGPGGWLKVSTDAGRVRQAAWQPAVRTESDQKWQRWIGFALAGLGVLATGRFIHVATRRATLSVEGLRVAGETLVPWECIRGVKTLDDRDGGIAVEYADASGQPRTVRLDEYRYRNVAALAEAIVARKPVAPATTEPGLRR